MSNVGNLRVEMQETEDYQFGWSSAERGEPRPEWAPASFRLECQCLGWDDFHVSEQDT